VLSTKKYRPENIGANINEFYSSGEAEWRFVRTRLAALGLTVNFNGTAVELGCGVGRVSRHLAASFANFVGFDVSEPHLELARQYLTSENVAAVQLKQLSSLFDLDFPEHDLFYSRIVLQHNPPPIQKFLLNAAMSRLRLGGIAVFQLLTAIDGYSFRTEEYLAKMNALSNQELHALSQPDIFALLAANGCIPVEVVRETGVTGFDKVSTVFTVRKPLS
jgi:2-polyprenyl-3-methyl-5-hydroxy-6-metoxy-1,4-benzoquinol methylase